MQLSEFCAAGNWPYIVVDKHVAARQAFLEWFAVGKPRVAYACECMKRSRVNVLRIIASAINIHQVVLVVMAGSKFHLHQLTSGEYSILHLMSGLFTSGW